MEICNKKTRYDSSKFQLELADHNALGPLRPVSRSITSSTGEMKTLPLLLEPSETALDIADNTSSTIESSTIVMIEFIELYSAVKSGMPLASLIKGRAPFPCPFALITVAARVPTSFSAFNTILTFSGFTMTSIFFNYYG